MSALLVNFKEIFVKVRYLSRSKTPHNIFQFITIFPRFTLVMMIFHVTISNKVKSNEVKYVLRLHMIQ